MAYTNGSIDTPIAKATNTKKKVVVFEPMPKQLEFMECALSGEYNVIYYGGAAGGGKTYVALATLIALSKLYPGSCWCVIRKDAGRLKKNTIRSFQKLLPKGFMTRFNDNVAYFKNGSTIIFSSENYEKDKDLTWMDGFEPNGFLLEESQELQLNTYRKAKLRSGRNLISPMPTPLVIVTGNPNQKWSKDEFYEHWKAGTLPPRVKYIQALMSDNSKLSDTYKEALQTLDEFTRQRYAEGNWDVIDVENPFAYKFDFNKHTAVFDSKPSKSLPLWLVFDFNKDPMTCIAAQTSKFNWIKVYKEFRIPHSDIKEMCDQIIAEYGDDYYFQIAGDASGQHDTALEKNKSYYTEIKKYLGVLSTQFKLRKKNPDIANNRVLLNALLERMPSFLFNRKECRYTIEDMQYVEVNAEAEIDKKKDKHRSHLLDCVRYLVDITQEGFVKIKI